jgi:Holliday junction resolvasome RuvABC endonuclease subunit
MRKRVLGLDPGMNFGWAVLEANDSGIYYVAGGTKVHKTKGKEPKAKRWSDCDRWISALLVEHAPNLVAIESVRRHAGVLAAHSYGFYRYCVEARCYDAEIECVPLDVTAWKKLACGVGSGKKAGVSEAVAELFPGVSIDSDDHSDAIGIALAAARSIHQPCS